MGNIDQRGFDNPSSAYLDGRAAAAFLGVKRETLYAYASRGLVRSEPGPRGRARRYARDDLEALKARHDARAGHGAVAGAALRWGEPVLETAVGTIDAAGPIYRGLRALDLANAGRSFESVAELLWSGELPAHDVFWPAPRRIVPAAVLGRLVPRATRPVDALGLAVPALALADADRFGASPAAELVRARAMALELAACLGLAAGAGRVEAARRVPTVASRALVALGRPAVPSAVRALERALVVLADHELNVSSFAVRVVASTGTDLYACVSAGLAAVAGPRHGGEVDRVMALAEEIGAPARVSAVVAARTRRGEPVPGFGHRLYPAGDPRATPLIAAAAELAPDDPTVRTLLALVRAMRRAHRPAPTVDVGLAALAAALALPAGSASAVFALGRIAGWVAHVFEQRAAGFLLRPRARYVGQLPSS